jgi:SAM-dependent methyltransferase
VSSSSLASAAAVRSIARFEWALPLLFGSTILTSACLLFLVQPLVSKMILPWFGGSAAVWVTAMLFFQTCLLLGYLYAHFLTLYLSPRLQVFVHTTLLLVALAVLPIVPSPRWIPKPGEDPTLAVFLVLGTCVGLPYLLLSATSPLIQKWFSQRSEGALPYRYFALSNAGSLLALFAFPLLVEPRLTGHQQSYLWSGAFVFFAVLCGMSALFQLRDRPGTQPVSRMASKASSFGMVSLWTGLAACASALLLIVTNLLTQNIAPMPLLWVVPLGIYLLTFVFCFDGSFWYRRWLFAPLFLPALAYIGSTTHTIEDGAVFRIVPFLIAALFVTCMTCHGELARLKPEAEQLTTFYLSIAFGGALGGLAIALLAPRFFNANYEYPIVISASAAVLLIPFWRERKTWRYPQAGMAIWLAAAASCVVLSAYATMQLQANQHEAKLLVRNFYGPLRIDEFKDIEHRRIRQLNHGTITHGTQILEEAFRRTATSYYGRESGVGLTWRILEQAGPINMGVIGLGTGTLAAYGRAGDSLRFYDINPLVIDIARNRFTYISDSPAHIDISLGDARLSLEQQAPQLFDILVVDAFSGDAIPVHLLTEEAFRIYWRHLKPDGVLAVHISNRYLDLAPVVAAAANGKNVRLVDNDDDDRMGVFESSYVLVTSRPAFFDNPLLEKVAATIKLPPGMRRWTDDYSNLWQALKFDD